MFKFRLQSVLRLREYREKQCQDEVAKCLVALQAAQERQQELESILAEKEEEIKAIQVGPLDMNEIILHQDYLFYLKELLYQQKMLVVQKSQELHIARKRLVEAMKEKKILNKLEEKQLQKYIYQQDKREQATLDDLAHRG